MTDPIRDHLHREQPAAEQALLDLLRIPSVSTDPAHAGDVRTAAAWLQRYLTQLGFQESEIIETPGHPAVTARWHPTPGAPTVLVYGHYDVQPVDPIEEWSRPPFEPVIEDGFVWGRGASDDKGQLLALIHGVGAYIATDRPTPVNVTVLLEGEEEINSAHLSELAEREADRLTADAIVAADSLMLDRHHPTILTAVRGHAFVEVTVTGPRTDLHSGTFGGAVDNPINVLARLLATLQDAESRKVLVPGFYDDVAPLTDSDRRAINAAPITDELGLALTGAPALAGEEEFTIAERVGARPTIDVVGIVGGFTGTGKKSVIPAAASAKVSMRLVPDQRVADIVEKTRSHLERIAPDTVLLDVSEVGGARSEPGLMDPSDPWVRAAEEAFERSHGHPPLLIRGGGSEPMVRILGDRLGVPVVMPGFGLPDDNNHAPNERMALDLYHRGAEWMAAYLEVIPRFLGLDATH